MRRSFYHYLMTLKGGKKTNESMFAEAASKDIQFPKHSNQYEEISTYLEMNVDYLSSMQIFDDLWEKYLENNR